MAEGGAYLYIAESTGTHEIYIGIGTSTSRIYGAHNPEAERLIKDSDTELWQTEQKFSTRDDARRAEAVAIHIAASAGKRVILDSDDPLNEFLSPTNRAGIKSSRFLVPVVPRKEGTVPFSSLTNTAIVTMKPEALTNDPGRGSVHGAKTPQELAARALTSWSLDASRRRKDKVSRLIARMKSSNVIIADWDLNPEEPTREDAFLPVDSQKIDPRGTRGMTLDLEGARLGNTVTWSQDIRDTFKARTIPGR
jgi:hypothetical protein